MAIMKKPADSCLCLQEVALPLCQCDDDGSEDDDNDGGGPI